MTKIRLEIATATANKPALLVEIEAEADYKDVLSHALGAFEAIEIRYRNIQLFLQNIENETASDDTPSIPEDKKISAPTAEAGNQILPTEGLTGMFQ